MKVLLIDDDEDIRKIGKLSLEAVGKHQVATAGSAIEGIQAATSDRPDVILMDMMMPGMDGLVALSELQRLPDLKSIPVVFITAKVQRSEAARYIALGAIGVLHKPFDPMKLSQELSVLLAAAKTAAGATRAPG